MELTYKTINKKLGGVLNHILKDAEYRAAEGGFSDGYGFGKALIEHHVGWHRDCNNFPELKTQAAYEIVLEKLSAACWRGDDTYSERRQQDTALEMVGVFTRERAAECACFRDFLTCCTPGRCLAWRPTDARRGYCALIGCSAEV